MRILVPLDGTHGSELILPWVEHLLDIPSAEAHVMHVSLSVAPGVPVTRAGPEGAPDDCKAYIARILPRFVRWPGRVHGHAWHGEPTISILRLARELPADFIAMRCHARQGVQRVVFGSVTSTVLECAHAPLFVIGPQAKPPEAAVKVILVPLDGSTLAGTVLRDIAPLAKAFGAEVVLFHVGADRFAVESAAAWLAKEGIAARVELGSGAPAADILVQVARQNAGLLAMTTHGRGAVTRLLLGSVASAVIAASPVPVVVRRPDA